MNIYLKVFLLIPFLTACSSMTDMRIPLSEAFESDSTLFVIESPTWRVPDSVYNKKIAGYSVVNAKTSFRKSKKELINNKTIDNSINFLLFNDKDYSIEVNEYEVESNISFSFDLQADGLKLSSAYCKINSLNTDEREVSEEEKKWPYSTSDRSENNREHRLKTYLSCSIELGRSSWDLQFSSNKNRMLKLKLDSDIESFKVLNVSDFIFLHEDEKGDITHVAKEGSYYPRKYLLNTGLEFFNEFEQVSALSFVGKPRVWINNNSPEEKKQLFLTVNYSLLMFNWLDSAWR